MLIQILQYHTYLLLYNYYDVLNVAELFLCKYICTFVIILNEIPSVGSAKQYIKTAHVIVHPFPYKM